MDNSLRRRRILLIISGGIAAYKSLELIRGLRKAGAAVRCVLTSGGARFVTPLSVSALSGEPVHSDLWAEPMAHIRLSREADLVLVAPATANLMAKMAHGSADDLASAVLLASDKPIMIAPAMNVEMWRGMATQANVATLRMRGVKIVGPDCGVMACGEEGAGRLLEPAKILAEVVAHFSIIGALSGRRALVTSGPTFEQLDPVRYIGNRSSGKQGHALAEALARYGAETVLVAGPTHLPDPSGVKTVHVETAREMLAACEAELPADIAICAAAVADWRVAAPATEKMKKDSGAPSLSFVENPDILATLSKAGAGRPRLVIGFAAETSDAEERAAQKLRRKGCDWIIANEVGGGKAFGGDENEVTLLRTGHPPDRWPRQSKSAIAERVVGEIARVFAG